MNRKIALLNDSFPPCVDGVANCVFNYADVLRKTDNIKVITPYYPEANDNYDFAVSRYSSLPTTKKLGYRVGNPLAVENLKYFFKKNRFDIIHVHSPFASGVLSRIMRRKDCVLVTTYHTKFEYDFEKRLKHNVSRKVATKFILSNINACDEVWVVSQGAGESLRNIGYKGEYVVMPNGTDFPEGRASKEQIDAINYEYRLNGDETVLLFVGRMMWYKNTKLIFDACKIAADKGFKFRLLMCGDGVDRLEMERYVKHIGIDDKVTFTGSIVDRDKLYAFYTRAYLFMFPSSYDTSGLVVREAAATGCPSLLLKGSCASEGVLDRYSGFLSKGENAEAVAEKLIECLSDKKLRDYVGLNAQKNVYLSWENAVARASKRYDYLLLKKKASKK